MIYRFKSKRFRHGSACVIVAYCYGALRRWKVIPSCTLLLIISIHLVGMTASSVDPTQLLLCVCASRLFLLLKLFFFCCDLGALHGWRLGPEGETEWYLADLAALIVSS